MQARWQKWLTYITSWVSIVRSPAICIKQIQIYLFSLLHRVFFPSFFYILFPCGPWERREMHVFIVSCVYLEVQYGCNLADHHSLSQVVQFQMYYFVLVGQKGPLFCTCGLAMVKVNWDSQLYWMFNWGRLKGPAVNLTTRPFSKDPRDSRDVPFLDCGDKSINIREVDRFLRTTSSSILYFHAKWNNAERSIHFPP